MGVEHLSENPYDSPCQLAGSKKIPPRAFQPYVVASCWVVIFWFVLIAVLFSVQIVTVDDGLVSFECTFWSSSDDPFDELDITTHFLMVEIDGACILLSVAVAVSLVIVNIAVAAGRWVLKK